MRESVFVKKVTEVKLNKMLLLVRMSMKIQTQISNKQNQKNVSFTNLMMFFNGKF